MADESIQVQLETVLTRIDGLDEFVRNIERSLRPLEEFFQDGVARITFDESSLRSLQGLLEEIQRSVRAFRETLTDTDVVIKINNEDVENFKRVIESAFTNVLDKMSVQAKQISQAARGVSQASQTGTSSNEAVSQNATERLAEEVEEGRVRLQQTLGRLESAYRDYNTLNRNIAGVISDNVDEIQAQGERLSSPLGRFRIDAARTFKRNLEGIAKEVASFISTNEELRERVATSIQRLTSGTTATPSGFEVNDREIQQRNLENARLAGRALAEQQRSLIVISQQYDRLAQTIERTLELEKRILAIEDKRVIRGKQVQNLFTSGLQGLFTEAGSGDFDKIATSLELVRNLGQQTANDIKALSAALALSEREVDGLRESLRELNAESSRIDNRISEITQGGPGSIDQNAEELEGLRVRRQLLDQETQAIDQQIGSLQKLQQVTRQDIELNVQQAAETRRVREELRSLLRVQEEQQRVFENARRTIQRSSIESRVLANVYKSVNVETRLLASGQRQLNNFISDVDVSILESSFSRAQQRINELRRSIETLRIQEENSRANLRAQAENAQAGRAGAGVFRGLDSSEIQSRLKEGLEVISRQTKEAVDDAEDQISRLGFVLQQGINDGIQDGIATTRRFDRLKDELTKRLREISTLTTRIEGASNFSEGATGSDAIRASAGEIQSIEKQYDSLTKQVAKLLGEFDELGAEVPGELGRIEVQSRRLEDAFGRVGRVISQNIFGSSSAASNQVLGKVLVDGAERVKNLGFQAQAADARLADLFAVISRGGLGTAQAIQEFTKLGNQARTNSQQLALYVAQVERAEAAGVTLSAQDRQNVESAKALINIYRQQAAALDQNAIALKRIGDQAKTAGKGFQIYSDELADSILQNFKFVNSITVVTSVLFGLRTAFTELVEESRAIARTLTVLNSVNVSAAETQERLTKAVRETSIEFGESIGTSAEIVKQLGSAGFDLETSLSALNSTMKLVVATQGDAQASAQTIAGIYRIFGKDIQGTGRAADAFKTINDVLITVYQKHQAELDELNQGFRFSASSAQIAGFTFQETASFLAVLNDNMIKSGRAGRSLQVIFSRLAKDSQSFSDAFGVELDPSRTLNDQFIGILRELNSRLDGGAISVNELAKNFQNLGLRGAPAFITLVRQFDALEETLKQTNEEAANTADALSLIVRQSLAKEFESAKQALIDIARQGIEPLQDVLIIATRLFIGIGDVLRAIPFLSVLSAATIFFAAFVVGIQTILAVTQVVITLSRQFGILASSALEAAAAIEVENATVAKGSGFMLNFARATGVAAAEQGKLATQSRIANAVVGGGAAKAAKVLGVLGLAVTGVVAAYAIWGESSRDLSRRLEQLSVDLGNVDRNVKSLANFRNELSEVGLALDRGNISDQVAGQRVVEAFDKVGANLVGNAAIIGRTNQQIARSFGPIREEAERLVALQETVQRNEQASKQKELTAGLTDQFRAAFSPDDLLPDSQEFENYEKIFSNFNIAGTEAGRKRAEVLQQELTRLEQAGNGYNLIAGGLRTQIDLLNQQGGLFNDAREQINNLLSIALDIRKSGIGEEAANGIINQVVDSIEKKSPQLAQAFRNALAAAESKGAGGLNIPQVQFVDELVIGANVLKSTFDNIFEGPLSNFARLEDTFNGITESVRATREESKELLKLATDTAQLSSVVPVGVELGEVFADVAGFLPENLGGETFANLSSSVTEGIDKAVRDNQALRASTINVDTGVLAQTISDQILRISGPRSEQLQREIVNRLASQAGIEGIAEGEAVNRQAVIRFAKEYEDAAGSTLGALGETSQITRGFIVAAGREIVDVLGLSNQELGKFFETFGENNNISFIERQEDAFRDLSDAIVDAAIATTTFNDRQQLVNNARTLRQQGNALASARSGAEGDANIRTSLQQRINFLGDEFAGIFKELAKIRQQGTIGQDEFGNAVLSDEAKASLESVQQRQAAVKEELDLYTAQIVANKTIRDLDEQRSNAIQLAVFETRKLIANYKAEGAQLALNQATLEKKVELTISEAREVEKLTRGYRNSREAVLEIVQLGDELLQQQQARIDSLNEEATLQFEILARIEKIRDARNKNAGIEFEALALATQVARINGELLKVQGDTTADVSERLALYDELTQLAEDFQGILERTKEAEDDLIKSLDRRADVLKKIRDEFRADADDIGGSLEESLQTSFEIDELGTAIKLAEIFGTTATRVRDNFELFSDKFSEGVQQGTIDAGEFDNSLRVLGDRFRDTSDGARFYNQELQTLRQQQFDSFEDNFQKAIEAGRVEAARKQLDNLKGAIDDLAGTDRQRKVELLRKALEFENTLFEAEASNVRRLRIQLELIGQDKFVAALKTLRERIVNEVGTDILNIAGFGGVDFSQAFGEILSGQLTAEDLGFFKNDQQRDQFVAATNDTASKVSELADIVSRLKVGENDTKAQRERQAIVQSLKDVEAAILGPNAPTQSRVSEGSQNQTVTLDSRSVASFKEVAQGEIEITRITDALDGGFTPLRNFSRITQEQLAALTSSRASLPERFRALGQEAQDRFDEVVRQITESVQRIQNNSNRVLSNEERGQNAQGDRVGDSVLDRPERDPFNEERLAQFSRIVPTIFDNLVRNFDNAISELSGTLSSFLGDTLVPEFASANAEVYRDFVETIGGIEEAYENQFDAATVGLQRNETDYLSYLNTIENAERQRVEARLNAEEQYRNELITSQEVFRDQVRDASGEIFDSLIPAINSIGEGTRTTIFGDLDKDLQNVSDQLQVFFRPGEGKNRVDFGKLGTSLSDIFVGSLITGSTTVLSSLAGSIAEVITLSFDEENAATTVRFIERFVEDLPRAAQRFTEVFESTFTRILQAVGEAAPVILETLIASLPEILEVIVTTLEESLPGIVSAIATALPQVVAEIVPAISALFGVILQQIPTVVGGLIGGAGELVGALIAELPNLIAAIIGAIIPLIGAVISQIPNIAIAIFEGLVQGLINAFFAIIEPIANLFGQQVEAPDFTIPRFHDGGYIGGPNEEQLIIAQRGEGVLSRTGLRALGGEDVLNQLNSGRPLEVYHSGGAVGTEMTMMRNRSSAGMVDNSSNNVVINSTVNVSGTANPDDIADKITKRLDSNLAKMSRDRKSKFKRTL